MKKRLFNFLNISLLSIFVIGSVVFSSDLVFAKPEKIEIKSAQRLAKENNARKNIQNVRLEKIADPEARKAIKEIFQYLNLSTNSN